MPAVVGYHDPRFSVGANAFVSYWESWLKNRRALNEFVLKQRMAALDPNARLKEMQQIRAHISDLERLRANILRDGARAHGQERHDEIVGRWKVEATANAAAGAYWNAQSALRRQQVATGGRLLESQREALEERQKTAPGDEARRLAVEGARQAGGAPGGPVGERPVEALDRSLGAALTAEKAGQTGEKADRIRLEFYLTASAAAEAEKDPARRAALEEARDAFAQEHFQTTDPRGVSTFMETRYGLSTAAEMWAEMERVLDVGGIGGLPPERSYSAGYRTETSGPAGTVGAVQAQQAALTVPTMQAAVPGAPAPAAEIGPPAAAEASPLAVAMGLAGGIDERIAKAEADLARLEAERARPATSAFPGFGVNVFTEPLMAAPGGHPADPLVRLAAENDPIRLRAIHEALARAGGSPERALALIDAEGGLPYGAPHYANVADPGQPLIAWLDDQLRSAMADSASDDPERKAKGARTLSEAVRAAHATSDTLRVRAPALYQSVAAAWDAALASAGEGVYEADDDPSEGSRRRFRREEDGRLFIVFDKAGKPYTQPIEVDRATAAGQAIDRRLRDVARSSMLGAMGQGRAAAAAGAENDIHLSELLADRANTARTAGTPAEKVGAARATAAWVASLPPSLAGQWQEVVPRTVEANIAQGRGQELMRDMANLEREAYLRADEQREFAARERAMAPGQASWSRAERAAGAAAFPGPRPQEIQAAERVPELEAQETARAEAVAEARRRAAALAAGAGPTPPVAPVPSGGGASPGAAAPR